MATGQRGLPGQGGVKAMTWLRQMRLVLALMPGPAAVHAAPGLPVQGYDDALCVTAQRLLVGQPEIAVRVQQGQGNGFYTIQMGIDEPARTLVVAMTSGTAAGAGGTEYPAWIACKMVNRERVSDVLGLTTSAPARTCRDVNDHTLQVAMNRLSPAERKRLAERGITLELAPDTVLPTGGEWLPASVDDYVTALPGGGQRVSAPAVVVPWDDRQRGFFQGTHHCKLLTLATVERWVKSAAAGSDVPLLPTSAGDCHPEAVPQRGLGSCLFYFAPVDAMVCQDYSGEGWNEAAAQQECGKRHASKEALRAAGQRYEGSGGRWAPQDCSRREDAPTSLGSCVFQCGARDETRWHLPGQPGGGPAGPMARFCQVFVPAASD
jgi:hypothetical protein